MASEGTATVLVCTRNRPESLERTLRSILADRSTVERELVVVDNGPSEEAAAAVERIRREAPFPVRYAVEPRVGVSHARNLAARLAGGELLLWTDDDVLVADGWADALAAVFADPRVAGAGGRILPRWPAPPPAWMDGPHAVTLTLPDFGPEPRVLGGDALPVGANMAIRAAVARRFEQPFRQDLGLLGPTGKRRMGFEEVALFSRFEPGELIAYAPDAVVHHCIESTRVDWDSMRVAWFQGGFGLARWERLRGEPVPSVPRLAVRTLRTVRGALAIRRANGRLAEPTAADAWREFHAYMWAGKHLELLLGRFPRLADRVADAVAR